MEMNQVNPMMLKTMVTGVAVLALSAGASLAAAPKPNASEKAGPASVTSQAVEQAHLSANLAEWGRTAKNPQALILAAQILSGAGGKAEARTKTQDGPPAASGGAAKTDKPATSVASLLDEARALAGPDQGLQTAITQVASLEGKGRVGGPAVTHDRVSALTTDTFNISFRGGERASVLVDGDGDGDGDTDLDLYVYDQNGNRICDDTDDTDTMLCNWTPAWTGVFTVKIKNYGNVYNAYTLMTN